VSLLTDWATVTVKEAVAVMLSESVAEHVTSVAPTGKMEPEAGEQVTVGSEVRAGSKATGAV
jgi:hypothetical protein